MPMSYRHLMLHDKAQVAGNRQLVGITQFAKLTGAKFTTLDYNGLLVKFFTIDKVIVMFRHVKISKLANKCMCLSLFNI